MKPDHANVTTPWPPGVRILGLVLFLLLCGIAMAGARALFGTPEQTAVAFLAGACWSQLLPKLRPGPRGGKLRGHR